MLAWIARLFSGQSLLYVIFGLIGVILILIRPHIPESIWGYSYIMLLCDGIGSSFIIATVMIYSVEAASKHRQEKSAEKVTEKISKDVFQAIYKRYIPSSIFKEVEACLLSCDISREDFTIDCRLLEVDADLHRDVELPDNLDKYFSLFSHNTYKLINNTDRTITHTICTFVEMPIDERLFPLVAIQRVRIDGYELSKEEIQSGTIAKADKSALGFKRDVVMAPGASFNVSISYRTIKQKVDMEVWSTREPTDRLKLKVQAPNGVEIQATANHSQELEGLPGGLPGCFEWNLCHGIFPHQSVIFWWHQT